MLVSQNPISKVQRFISVFSFFQASAAYQLKRIRANTVLMQWKASKALPKVISRALDVTVSLSLLLLGAPAFLLIAFLIKRHDGGPVFYWQKRVGEGGKEFDFPKFRTMVVNADKLREKLLEKSDNKGSLTFKMKEDPRITPVGRFLRRFSIDEMPQLLCVLQGSMGLVGPRPPIPSEVREYTSFDRRRLQVKPGLTCIWQVSGRSNIPFDGQVLLDRQYIDERNLLVDLKLLFLTIPAVLTGRGAY